MAINVKELREMLSQFPDDLIVVVPGNERTSDYLEMETVEIVEGVLNEYGYGIDNPKYMSRSHFEKLKDNKQKFVYVGSWR
jgi:hypothetical protein